MLISLGENFRVRDAMGISIRVCWRDDSSLLSSGAVLNRGDK